MLLVTLLFGLPLMLFGETGPCKQWWITRANKEKCLQIRSEVAKTVLMVRDGHGKSLKGPSSEYPIKFAIEARALLYDGDSVGWSEFTPTGDGNSGTPSNEPIKWSPEKTSPGGVEHYDTESLTGQFFKFEPPVSKVSIFVPIGNANGPIGSQFRFTVEGTDSSGRACTGSEDIEPDGTLMSEVVTCMPHAWRRVPTPITGPRNVSFNAALLPSTFAMECSESWDWKGVASDPPTAQYEIRLQLAPSNGGRTEWSVWAKPLLNTESDSQDAPSPKIARIKAPGEGKPKPPEDKTYFTVRGHPANQYIISIPEGSRLVDYEAQVKISGHCKNKKNVEKTCYAFLETTYQEREVASYLQVPLALFTEKDKSVECHVGSGEEEEGFPHTVSKPALVRNRIIEDGENVCLSVSPFRTCQIKHLPSSGRVAEQDFGCFNASGAQTDMLKRLLAAKKVDWMEILKAKYNVDTSKLNKTKFPVLEPIRCIKERVRRKTQYDPDAWNTTSINEWSPPTGTTIVKTLRSEHSTFDAYLGLKVVGAVAIAGAFGAGIAMYFRYGPRLRHVLRCGLSRVNAIAECSVQAAIIELTDEELVSVGRALGGVAADAADELNSRLNNVASLVRLQKRRATVTAITRFAPHRVLQELRTHEAGPLTGPRFRAGIARLAQMMGQAPAAGEHIPLVQQQGEGGGGGGGGGSGAGGAGGGGSGAGGLTAGGQGSGNALLGAASALITIGGLTATLFGSLFDQGQRALAEESAKRGDCQFEWGPWAACSVSCGEGVKQRKPTVTAQPSADGQACPSDDEDKCTMPECDDGGVTTAPLEDGDNGDDASTSAEVTTQPASTTTTAPIEPRHPERNLLEKAAKWLWLLAQNVVAKEIDD